MGILGLKFRTKREKLEDEVAQLRLRKEKRDLQIKPVKPFSILSESADDYNRRLMRTRRTGIL